MKLSASDARGESPRAKIKATRRREPERSKLTDQSESDEPDYRIKRSICCERLARPTNEMQFARQIRSEIGKNYVNRTEFYASVMGQLPRLAMILAER